MLRNRKGFTLIELLIVVVIIGILAAIALPKFGETRQRAYISAMQSDLRNLQTAQEMYYSDTNKGAYNYLIGVTLQPEVVNTDLDFTASSGVSIVLTAGAAADAALGYLAVADHVASDTTCRVEIGGAGSSGITCATSP